MEKTIEEVRVAVVEMMSRNLIVVAVYSIAPDYEIATCGDDVGEERWE